MSLRLEPFCLPFTWMSTISAQECRCNVKFVQCTSCRGNHTEAVDSSNKLRLKNEMKHLFSSCYKSPWLFLQVSLNSMEKGMKCRVIRSLHLRVTFLAHECCELLSWALVWGQNIIVLNWNSLFTLSLHPQVWRYVNISHRKLCLLSFVMQISTLVDFKPGIFKIQRYMHFYIMLLTFSLHYIHFQLLLYVKIQSTISQKLSILNQKHNIW